MNNVDVGNCMGNARRDRLGVFIVGLLAVFAGVDMPPIPIFRASKGGNPEMPRLWKDKIHAGLLAKHGQGDAAIRGMQRVYQEIKGVNTMEEKNKIAVEGRKLQENLENMTQAGIQREMAKYHRTLYSAYVTEGFLPDQAMQLVIAHIQTPAKA